MKKEVVEEIKEIIKNQGLDINLNQNEEKIIKEFKNDANWWNISMHQKLSESFIREFQDKVEWELINKNKKIIKTKKFQELINRELLIGVLKK